MPTCERRPRATSRRRPRPWLRLIPSLPPPLHPSPAECEHPHDSPQWRKGPPQHPVLCNACGTRLQQATTTLKFLRHVFLLDPLVGSYFFLG